MSDGYDDGLPQSSFSLSSYMLGQHAERREQSLRELIDSYTGRAPVASGDYNALLAQYESVVDYANQLVQQVNALKQQNVTLAEDYRQLRVWAVKAEADLRRNTQEIADQSHDITRLNDIIDDLQAELASKDPPVRTD